MPALFGSGAVSGFGFVEEALPFTDAIPTATIAWAVETFQPNSGIARALGLTGENEEEEGKEK